MYGNHASQLAEWGADSNVVLARHYTIPQSLHSCSTAIDPVTSQADKIDLVGSCIGNMREMSNFGIVTVDQARLNRLRYRLIPYMYSSAKATHDTGAPFIEVTLPHWRMEIILP